MTQVEQGYWILSWLLLWADRAVEMAMLFDRDELVSLLILRCVSVRVRERRGLVWRPS